MKKSKIHIYYRSVSLSMPKNRIFLCTDLYFIIFPLVLSSHHSSGCFHFAGDKLIKLHSCDRIQIYVTMKSHQLSITTTSFRIRTILSSPSRWVNKFCAQYLLLEILWWMHKITKLWNIKLLKLLTIPFYPSLRFLKKLCLSHDDESIYYECYDSLFRYFSVLEWKSHVAH